MDQKTLARLKTWFNAYAASFSFPDEKDRENIRLKQEHTQRVCGNIVHIAREERFDDADVKLAETVALLHDIGRFPQYETWRTYRDGDSTDHARLGVRVLRDRRILDGMPLRERRIVLAAVGLHNVFVLDPRLDRDVARYLRMVRDADRIDIWRVAAELYRKRRDQWPSALGLGLNDAPERTPEILALLGKRSAVPSALVRTVTDYKLLQLAWLFDLSFPASYRIAVEQGHFEEIAEGLPRDAEIESVLASIRAHVRARVERNDAGNAEAGGTGTGGPIA